MNLLLVAVTGPQSGKSFPVAAGYKIGRRRVEILLDDVKISNQHAVFVEENGNLFLRDLGSKNGLWLDGVRVPQIQLSPGLAFIIGTSEFRIETLPEKKKSPPVPHTIAPEPPPEAQAEAPAPVQRPFDRFLKRIAKDVQDKPRVMVPFVPALKLRFLKGLQTEQVWWIGYGPRSCGSQSLDLLLYEQQAPAVCFELLPTPRGITLKTSHSDIVKVNDVSSPTHLLKTGDLITIMNTCLEVEFE